MNRRASTHGRARRWGKRLLRVVGSLLLCLLVLVALVLASVNLPWVRARLAQEVSQRASEALLGTVSISRLGHIGFSSVAGIDAELLDPSGRRVLGLSGASVELDLTTLLRGLVGDAPLTVAFERIDLSRVDARLLEAPSGGLSLLEAFEPAPTSEPEVPTEGSSSEPLRWRFGDVTLEHATVQGEGSFENVDVNLQGLTARGSVDGEAARFELERVSFRARSLPVLNELEGRLSAAGQLNLDTPEGAPLELNARAQLSGAAAGIPFHARARYVDEQLSGYLDVHSSSSSLRRLWPDTAVEDPVSLFVGFDGTLSQLRVLSVLESSAGELYVRGHMSLSPQVTGRFSVVGSGLDAGGWLSDLPETTVQLAAALHFELMEGGVRGRVALRTWASTWAGRELPELALSARLGDDEAEGTLRFAMAGASAVVEATLSPLGPGEPEAQRLHVRVVASVRDLARLASELELGEELRGEVRLEGEVDVELEGIPWLTRGQITATLEGVTAGPVAVQSAELRVSPRGLLQAPRLSLSLNARQLSVPNYPINSLRLQGRGDLDELALSGSVEPRTTAPIRFEATLFPTRRLARDVELVMLDGGPAGAALRLSAERLALTSSGFEVRNLDVRGPVTGRLQLDASVRGGRVRVEGSATDFAPVVLSRQLGLPFDVPRGVLDLSVDMDYRPGHVSGQLRGGVTRFCMGEIRGGKLDAELAIEGNVLHGSAAIQIPDLVQARLEADALKLPRTWRPSQLSHVTGELELSASAELAQLRDYLPTSWLSASSRGRIRAHVSLTGEPGDRYPKLRVAMSTEELTWSLPLDAPREANGSGAGVAIQPERSTWQGMDVHLVTEVAGSSVTVSADIVDTRGGLLATLQGSTRVALDRLLRNPEGFDPRALPIELRLEVPNRQLEAFPTPLRFEGVDGSVNAQLTATGTVGRPQLSGQLTLTELRREGGRALPLAITADAELRDERLAVTAEVRDEQRKLLSLRARGEVSGGGATPGLEQLELTLRSNGLPLESLGTALGIDVSGELYGSLHLRDLPTQPTAQGTLWINDPSIAGFLQDQARWVIDADADSFSTQLELRQPGGHARASASGPWKWGPQLLPELQPAQTALELEAKDFELKALGAFMPEQARALSGRLDAEINVGSGGERRVAGDVRLTEGTLYVATLGQEFRDIQLDASVAASGAVSIERLSARALSGRVSARGDAKLDGLMLRTAHLVVEIPKNDPLPLMFEGVTVADAWGRLAVDARLDAASEQQSEHQLQIDVAVPRLHVILPEQAPQDVQALEEDSTIVTGTYLEPGRFLVLPIPPYQEEELDTDTSAPLVVNIEIELGDDVWVERSTQLEVKLAGSVGLTLKEQLSARGQLRLARGTLDVRGRVFEIERGVITFAEERAPSNPTVVATARYTGPEGTEVYAEFVGPVETGTLSLRSEPPLRDDQILSLLLFGTPDGNFGASTGNRGVSGAALAAGGSVVTQGLNQELRRFTALDIQTRIGEREGQPQPEVVVQVSPRLSAELAYNVANANPGRAQDRTYLTLDLRLFRNWSLSTTIGDAGSLLVDLFWRYRY